MKSAPGEQSTNAATLSFASSFTGSDWEIDNTRWSADGGAQTRIVDSGRCNDSVSIRCGRKAVKRRTRDGGAENETLAVAIDGAVRDS